MPFAGILLVYVIHFVVDKSDGTQLGAILKMYTIILLYLLIVQAVPTNKLWIM